jgi:hypothetical protein
VKPEQSIFYGRVWQIPGSFSAKGRVMTRNAVLIEKLVCLLPKDVAAKFACDSRKKGAILMAHNCIDMRSGKKVKQSAVLGEWDRPHEDSG